MKLSLNWIFDHIDADLSRQQSTQIIERFNEVSAEIDGVHEIQYDTKNLYVALIKNTDTSTTEVVIPELHKSVKISSRTDAQTPHKSTSVFLVKDVSGVFEWAQYKDFCQESESLIPTLHLSETYHDGSWRNTVAPKDIILDVDNKTITHRPDMWGHRGFAREIAAFMNLPFKPHQTIIDSLDDAQKNSLPSVAGEIKTTLCPRLVLAHFSSIENRPSDFFMAIRLMRLGSKVFNAIVDLTNYVMLDWSQPSHAYDAAQIKDKQIIVRPAKNDEEIIILDGSCKKLSPDDVVIASPEKALCIAGIKGGLDSGIATHTQSVVLEVATFDATSTRKTAHRLNLRTDASARFEKTLSAEQPIEALARFVFLAKQLGLQPILAGPIVNIAPQEVKPISITIEHQFIESRMGISLTQKQVISLLTPLEFIVSQTQITEKNCTYEIKVPHFRASKDVREREDIIEEITRMYGFNKIPLSLAARTTAPDDMSVLAHERNLKRIFASTSEMFEQKNYMYFDSNFTQQLGIDTSKCLSIVNPVSSTQSLLVDSLIPALLKNVEDNVFEYDALSFFEINATWNLQPNGSYKEEQRLAGIFFSRRNTVNFLNKKTLLTKALDEAGLHNASWRTAQSQVYTCFDAPQTATITHGDTVVGFAGFLRKDLLNKLTGVLPESSAIIFDLDYKLLKNNKKNVVKFKPLSRYQTSSLDISLMVPATTSYEFVSSGIQSLDATISEITLIDSFSKKEWKGDRSFTFRLKISNYEKTIDKNDLDTIQKKVLAFAEQNQLSIRE